MQAGGAGLEDRGVAGDHDGRVGGGDEGGLAGTQGDRTERGACRRTQRTIRGPPPGRVTGAPAGLARYRANSATGGRQATSPGPMGSGRTTGSASTSYRSTRISSATSTRFGREPAAQHVVAGRHDLDAGAVAGRRAGCRPA